MKNFLSYDLSEKLRKAGFPQPVPEFGQVWYFPNPLWLDISSDPFVVTGLTDDVCDYVCMGSTDVYLGRGLNSDEIFSPSASDILAQIPDCFLHFDSEKEAWVCAEMLGEFSFTAHSPAEACAEMWLAKVREKEMFENWSDDDIDFGLNASTEEIAKQAQ